MQGSKFTDTERHAIRQAIIDAMYSNLTDKDTLALIKNRTGIDIGSSTIGHFKREIKSGEVELWLDQYVQVGFIETLKESDEKLKVIQDGIFQKFIHEASKPIDEQRYMTLFVSWFGCFMNKLLKYPNQLTNKDI